MNQKQNRPAHSDQLSGGLIGISRGNCCWKKGESKKVLRPWQHAALAIEQAKLAAIPDRRKDEIDQLSRVDADIVNGVLARVPPSWTMLRRVAPGGYFRRGSIQAAITVQRYEDGRIWLHVSACGRKGKDSWYVPSWEEMTRVKNDLIGPDKWAYQVMATVQEHVNINPYCLHMFALLDGAPVLPDFTWGMRTL